MNRFSAFPLYVGFGLVGFCTALPGAVLPVLLTHWHLSDQRAGFLFLVLFLGSCVGSLSSRGEPTRLIAFGAAAMGSACCALALVSGWWVPAFFSLYGLGIGMLIASITRLRLLQLPARGVPEVNRLKLLWGVGAFLCPSIATTAIKELSVRTLLFTLTAMFLVVVVGALALRRPITTTAEDSAKPSASLPVIFALYTFLAVGGEAALGAWIATYSHRLQQGVFAPAEATSLFWLGLLSSRIVAGSDVSQKLGDRRLLRLAFAFAAAGGAVLLLAPDNTVLRLAALLVGLGLGPVFPTLLAHVLPRTSSNTIFVVGGIASSLLPWITGILSVHAGSLRTGMAVPATATLFLLLLSPIFIARMARWNSNA